MLHVPEHLSRPDLQVEAGNVPGDSALQQGDGWLRFRRLVRGVVRMGGDGVPTERTQPQMPSRGGQYEVPGRHGGRDARPDLAVGPGQAGREEKGSGHSDVRGTPRHLALTHRDLYGPGPREARDAPRPHESRWLAGLRHRWVG